MLVSAGSIARSAASPAWRTARPRETDQHGSFQPTSPIAATRASLLRPPRAVARAGLALVACARIDDVQLDHAVPADGIGSTNWMSADRSAKAFGVPRRGGCVHSLAVQLTRRSPPFPAVLAQFTPQDLSQDIARDGLRAKSTDFRYLEIRDPRPRPGDDVGCVRRGPGFPG